MSAIYLLLVLLCASAGAAEIRGRVIECEPQRVFNNKYWSWREIDGRKCWYQGQPGKPKTELHWPTAAPESGLGNRASEAEQPGSIRDAPRPPSAAPAREEVVPRSTEPNNTTPASPTEEQTAPVLKAETLLAYGQDKLRERSVPPPPLLPVPRERTPIWMLVLIILSIVGAASLLPIMRSMQWLTNSRK
jgi:hypothetical protein